MSGIQECVLYRDFARGEILEHMTLLMDALKEKDPDIREKKDLFFSCGDGLVETASSYGFSGDLWHTYLTLLLVSHENAFSTACELLSALKGSRNEWA